MSAEVITPGVAYRLSFEAEGQVAGATYQIHLRDAKGNLPFDGALEREWQRLTPEKKAYTHLFYAPQGAAIFELLAGSSGVTFSNVKLEKYESDQLFLNGDLSEGNYSGWSETYNTHLSENEGRPVLQVELNGYALTDFTPVVGGGHYDFKGRQGVAGARLLAYDSLRRLIGVIERKPGTPFTVPEDAAWLRAIYGTGHSHLPTWQKNGILKAELLPLETSSGASASRFESSADLEIVLAPGCDPREEHAARELQYWLAAITGKAPALLAAPSKGGTQKIFVGRAWGNLEDLRKLEGSDGCAVRTKEGNVYVFGARPRGTFYGVHQLLERNTDIIWPRPNPEFVAVFSKVPVITFSDADFLSRPAFEYRHVSRGGYTLKNAYVFQDWVGRNGLNSPWQLHIGNDYLVWQRGAQLGYGGSYMFWLADAKDNDKNVLPLLDGFRVDNVWRQPCYSYKGTADAIAARMRKLLETLPGRELEYIHATIADNWTVCGCPDCLSPIMLPNGEKLTTTTTDATENPLFFSTRNFLMLNKVAEALASDYPGLRITTHAYIFAAEPPGVPLHRAIVPEYAAYPTQNIRYPILSGDGKGQAIGSYTKEMWKRRFEQWGSEKRGELGYFGYYYVEGFNALADTAAEDYRALAGYGAMMAHTEGFPVDGDELSNWDADALEKWVIAKLMWDPSQEPEALRQEYIRRVYRGAESEMTAFYKLIRDAWQQAPESVFVNCHTPASTIFKNFVIDNGIEGQAKKLLVDAETAASQPQGKKIIQRHIAYFEKLAGTLGRLFVPYVEESRNEWHDATSPHWEKAAIVPGFYQVSDWRDLGREQPSRHPSSGRFMHDRENLYIRFDGGDDNLAGQLKPAMPAGQVFPHGDRFEVRLQGARDRDYYFAVGPGEHFYSQPPLGGRWKTVVSHKDNSWTAILAIPMNVFGNRLEESSTIKARIGRLYRLQGEEREESSHNGVGIFNEHPTFWMNLQIQ